MLELLELGRRLERMRASDHEHLWPDSVSLHLHREKERPPCFVRNLELPTAKNAAQLVGLIRRERDPGDPIAEAYALRAWDRVERASVDRVRRFNHQPFGRLRDLHRSRVCRLVGFPMCHDSGPPVVHRQRLIRRET